MIKYSMQKIYFFCHQEISEFIAGWDLSILEK
jgi:hypothetical protein